MLDNVVVLLVGYVLPLAVLWASIIWMRPIVARARVQRKAEAIHDELMDAIFRGEIDADNPRAIDALTYSEFLAKSAHELCISAVVAADMAADHVGYDLSTKFKEPPFFSRLVVRPLRRVTPFLRMWRINSIK